MAMFSRANEAEPARSTTTTSPPPMPAGRSSGSFSDRANTSVIGRDLTIMGQQLLIVTQGVLQVDGEVRGDLRGKEIVIGETGRVNGTVAAETIQVRGQVNGAIKGLNVQLLPTARVEGDIHHQSLSIAEGAIFDGRVRRPKDSSDLQPILDPNHFTAVAETKTSEPVV
jgi:cytoskeletal protein CcmA (bactofilin family)